MIKLYVLLCVIFTATIAVGQSGHSLNAFSKLTFIEKPFTLSGIIKGYDPVADSFAYCIVEYAHLYKAEEEMKTAAIDKDGRFSITFPVSRPNPFFLHVKDMLFTMYAVPGTSLSIEMDLPAAKKQKALSYEKQIGVPFPVSFVTGEFARLNKEYNNWQLVVWATRDNNEGDKIKTLDQPAYKKYKLGEMTRLLDTLTAFNRRNNTSTEFRQVATQSVRYNTANDLLRYSWLPKGNSENEKAVTLTPEYLSFLQDIPLNNEEAVVTEAYDSFLDEYSNLYTPKNVNFQPSLKEMAGFLRKLAQHDNDIDTTIISFLEQPVEKWTADQLEEAGELFNEHSAELEAFLAPNLVQQTLDSIRPHLTPGIGSDLILACEMLEGASVLNGRFTAQQLDSFLTTISNPYLRAYIKKEQTGAAQLLQQAVPSTATLRSPVEASGDQFFQELIKPYKGKVVYIDFWAPWCGPCMSDMPATKVLQQELKDKDIVFLFVAIQCTKSSWENTIKEKGIDGEHYLANTDEGALLANKFKISGIPHHVLVDKNGAVKEKNAPGVDEKEKLVKKLAALLK